LQRIVEKGRPWPFSTCCTQRIVAKPAKFSQQASTAKFLVVRSNEDLDIAEQTREVHADSAQQRST
jgi:hypothetical protein